jgi:phage tail sheath protein FI
MPDPVKFPGVFVEELSSGLGGISGVETSVTAFIGRALRGPTDGDDVRAGENGDIFSWGDYERVFGGLWTESAMSYAVRDFFDNGGRRAVIIRVFHADGPSRAMIRAGTVELVAASPGAWGNRLTVEIDHATGPADPEMDGMLFNLTVTDAGTGTSERFMNVTVVENQPMSLDRVLEGKSDLVRVRLGSMGGERPDATAGALVVESLVNDGGALEESDLLGQADAGTGLYALNKVEMVNVVCVPPYLAGGEVDLSVLAAAAQICVDRRAFLIVDAPVGWTTSEAATLGVGSIREALGENGRNAAVYFPWLCQPDPLRGGEVGVFPPCGAVAGVFARTDEVRGVWKGPAGVEAVLKGVGSLSVLVDDRENAMLNPLGVNCLRLMPRFGPVVWGSRTLRGADGLGDSTWRYVPVRRLALYIEESVVRSTRWAVFEPNDERLWERLSVNISAILHVLFREGALAGSTAKEAYFVRCDATTTVTADVARGLVSVQVGFAPLKPAEFVVLNIRVMAGREEGR